MEYTFNKETGHYRIQRMVGGITCTCTSANKEAAIQVVDCMMESHLKAYRRHLFVSGLSPDSGTKEGFTKFIKARAGGKL